MHVAELLDQPAESVPVWPTGLAGLDERLGGLRAGSLWVITGAPSSGKSLLLTQLVHTMAVVHGVPTDYFCSGSDHPDLTRSRLLSLAVRRPARPPALAVALDDLTERQAEALTALRGAPLQVFTGGGFTAAPLRATPGGVRCLAVDDPEGKRPPVLDVSGRHELRKVADDGGVVIVTVPRSHALEPYRTGDRLREEWASVADVLVELVPDSLGDAEVVIRQNRRGALWDVPVTLLGHRARFVDRAEP